MGASAAASYGNMMLTDLHHHSHHHHHQAASGFAAAAAVAAVQNGAASHLSEKTVSHTIKPLVGFFNKSTIFNKISKNIILNHFRRAVITKTLNLPKFSAECF